MEAKEICPFTRDVFLWRIGGMSVLIFEFDTKLGLISQFHASAALAPRENVYLVIE